MSAPLNIVIAGVGGQGTILASKLLAAAALAQGLPVRTAETIGMAQRGGSVLGHVRIGSSASPLVPTASANIIIGFELAETCRALPYLAHGGLVVSAQAAIAPVGITLQKTTYDGSRQLTCLSELAAKGVIGELQIIDVAPILASLGSAKILNVVLLGALLGAKAHGLFTQESLEIAIKELVKEKFITLNLEALRCGKNAIKHKKGI